MGIIAKGKSMRISTKVLAFLLCLWMMPGIIVEACTIFIVSDSKAVLVGNNEDTPLTDAKITFTPASAGKKYGKMVFSFDSFRNGFPQGGMNTEGLFFDIAVSPAMEVVFPPELVRCDSHRVIEKILEECSTVKEAIEVISNHTLEGIQGVQVFFADKTGDAAVVGVGKEKRIHVTWKKENFLVLSNFNLENPGAGGYPCYRHSLATEMLKENPEPSVANFRAVLWAVHTEGPATTFYSNICDLKNGEMYLYYFHDFESPRKIVLNEELKKGTHSITVESLFPRKPFAAIATQELREMFMKLMQQHSQK